MASVGSTVYTEQQHDNTESNARATRYLKEVHHFLLRISIPLPIESQLFHTVVVSPRVTQYLTVASKLESEVLKQAIDQKYIREEVFRRFFQPTSLCPRHHQSTSTIFNTHAGCRAANSFDG